MHQFAKCVALLVLLSACSGSDPRTVRITAENQGEIYNRLESSKVLTLAEARQLISFLDRRQEELGNYKLPPGRTLAEIFEEEEFFLNNPPSAPPLPEEDGELRAVPITSENHSEIFNRALASEAFTAHEQSLLNAYLDRTKDKEVPAGQTLELLLRVERCRQEKDELARTLRRQAKQSCDAQPEAVAETKSQEPDVDEAAEPVMEGPQAQPLSAVLPEGTKVAISLTQSLSSKDNLPGDEFEAVLDEELRVGDLLLAPRRSVIRGKIMKAGRSEGANELALTLTLMQVGDDLYPLATNVLEFRAKKQGFLKKLALGAAAGAAIGAVAAGRKGAAIGAAAGAGSGTAISFKGKHVEFEAEQSLYFYLSDPVEMRVAVEAR
ncbi:MAG TPA: hypothetical protein VLU25_07805 [Acidobacteriota bacterium]|nr:hypothetical protein [Acidobacteriota bacterium]